MNSITTTSQSQPHSNRVKKIAIGITAILFLIIGLAIYKLNSPKDETPTETKSEFDAQNSTYIIDGKPVTLVDGYHEEELAPGSASKEITRYFGNDVEADFNNDGTPDAAFLLTRESGGSGTFFYVAALTSNGEQYTGTNAILLGDRIAPQTTESTGGMILVNYADRKPGEPFTTSPSVGVSKYFKVVDGELKEATPKIGESEARAIAERTCVKGGETLTSGLYNENSKTWWFDANLNATQQGCNPACVVSEDTKTAEINWRCTGLINPEEQTREAIRKLFAQKYPRYANTVSVSVEKETQNHARGSVSFEAGAPGGIFLAAVINGKWQIVHDGNGQIPCNLSTYGFPSDMLADCAN